MSKATSPKKDQPKPATKDEPLVPQAEPAETNSEDEEGAGDPGGGIEIPKKPPPPITEP